MDGKDGTERNRAGSAGQPQGDGGTAGGGAGTGSAAVLAVRSQPRCGVAGHRALPDGAAADGAADTAGVADLRPWPSGAAPGGGVAAGGAGSDAGLIAARRVARREQLSLA